MRFFFFCFFFLPEASVSLYYMSANSKVAGETAYSYGYCYFLRKYILNFVEL